MLASAQAPRYPNTARDLLLVTLGGSASFGLFHWLLAEWAMLRFWESWVGRYPVLGTYGPFVAIAVLTGVFVGALVAAVSRIQSSRNLAWAGAFACVLSFGAAVGAGGVTWAVLEPTALLGPSLAFGLVVGGILVRKVSHA